MSVEGYAVSGLTTDMLVTAYQLATDANYLVLDRARVSSAGTLELTWINWGGGNNTVSPAAAQTVYLEAF